MKTIFTSLAIICTAFLYSQQAPPPVDWSQKYRVNDTYPLEITGVNNNVVTILAYDFPDYNLHMVKTDGTTILYDKIIKNVTDYNNPIKFLPTSDNGNILVSSNSLEKYDVNDNLVWNKPYEMYFHPWTGIKTNDDNFLVVGGVYTNTETNYFYRVRKTDQSGNTVWDLQAQKINNKWYYPESVLATSDGGFLMGGTYKQNFHRFLRDGYSLVKLDGTGAIIWEKIFPLGVPDSSAYTDCILQCNDGNYFIAGSSSNSDSNIGNSFYGKYDQSGNPIWTKFTPNNTYIAGVEKGVDNRYILMLGSSDDDSTILQKVDDSGDTV